MKKTDILLIIYFWIGSVALAEDTTKQNLPSVMVKTLEGTQVNIQDYGKTGKITVLFFWETYCSPSIKGLDNILDVYDDWQSKYKCQVVGINMDDSRNSSKVKPMVNGKGWPYMMLTDENKDLYRALNIQNCPFIIILNQLGHIVYRHSGYTEGFELELEEQMAKIIK